MIVNIHQGSILDVEADAIVNPANSFLRHGGGLAAIIDRAARKWPDTLHDYAIDDEYREQREAIERYESENAAHSLIPTGSAGWTSAGRLPYKGIVHAVGPIWGGGNYCEGRLLQSAYCQAFFVANSHGCKSVAAPAISAGIFGVPINVVASAAAYGAVHARLFGLLEEITFALFDEEHVAAFSSALADLKVMVTR